MKLQGKKIAIVGGGPGGLTLAKLLLLNEADVKVYERDLNKNARVQGSPLDLHDDSGLAAIIKANLLDEFKKTRLSSLTGGPCAGLSLSGRGHEPLLKS